MIKDGIKIATIALSALLLLGGCAQKELESKHSGFLGNYSDLKEDEKYVGTVSWIAPDADFKKYDSFIVTPVQINHGLEEKDKTPERLALFKKISEYLTEGYKQAIEKNSAFKRAETAGPKTLKLETSISAVAVQHDDLKFYQFIPVALVVTAVKRATVDHGSVRILGEARITDSQTNKVLLRGMSLRKGQEIKSEKDQLTFEEVKPALDSWLKDAERRLQELKANQR